MPFVGKRNSIHEQSLGYDRPNPIFNMQTGSGRYDSVPQEAVMGLSKYDDIPQEASMGPSRYENVPQSETMKTLWPPGLKTLWPPGLGSIWQSSLKTLWPHGLGYNIREMIQSRRK